MVLGCVILLIAYQGWLAWLLLVAVLGTPVLSLLVSLPAMLTARVVADLGGTVNMGDEVTAKVTAVCRFPMPEYSCSIGVRRAVTGESWVLKSGQKMPTEHCGALVCSLKKCYIYDYLNLFRIKAHVSREATLLVQPVPVKVAQPSRLERRIACGFQPKAGGGFAEHHEMRLYRPGDGMNQVHWKLTAKTGKLMVREAMEPIKRQLVLELEICGGAEQVDAKMGKLLWLGEYLLGRQLHFEVHAITKDGLLCIPVRSEQELALCMVQLLCAEHMDELNMEYAPNAAWSYHIGGGTDEA